MNRFNKSWATMLELIAMMAIMGLGIASMLGVIQSGSYFAKDTEDTIRAINLAREGIEWITNIRNTNWQRFSSDKTNCWIVQNYNAVCIWWAVVPKISTGSYTLYNRNGLWYLSGGITYSDPTGVDWTNYSTTYRTWLDDRGFYTQTGMTAVTTPCIQNSQTGCLTPFTREIQAIVSWTGTLYVKSIVRWKLRRPMEVIIDATLTNWKSKF